MYFARANNPSKTSCEKAWIIEENVPVTINFIHIKANPTKPIEKSGTTNEIREIKDHGRKAHT